MTAYIGLAIIIGLALWIVVWAVRSTAYDCDDCEAQYYERNNHGRWIDSRTGQFLRRDQYENISCCRHGGDTPGTAD